MTNLIRTAFAVFITSCLAGCSSSSGDDATGGTPGLGGKSSGGASNGGSPTTGNGGSQSGGAASGGSSQGGAPGSGGQTAGGKSNGGSSAGGATAGSTGAGGNQPRGGATGTGGAAAGSGNMGGTAGGASMGGSTGGGNSSGGSGQTCPMPSTFKWTSGGPIASPTSGWDSIKDFNYAPTADGKHMIYMSNHAGSSYGAAMMSFADWPAAATATQNKLSFAAVAPSIFYFSPKQTWILAYQWGATGFSYRTSSDPTNPSGWSGEKSLYASKSVPAGSSSTGVIDQTVICDTAKCYLFFNGDNGYVYRSSMPIASFPGEFPAATTVMQDTPQKIFEAVQVYTIKGANKYLMLVEAQGNGRYFRAWTATDLGGTWTLLTDSFAAKSNTTFSQNWTNDISHGDLVRSGNDETIPIDPCDLKMIYQGRDPNSTAQYDKLPYKLGLLTAVK